MIEVKNITLMDETETKEATQINNKKKWCYLYFIFIPLIFVPALFVGLYYLMLSSVPITSINTFISTDTTILLFDSCCLLILVVFVIIYFAICHKKMRTSRKLLKIARNNDLVKHNAKIKFSENKRLEMAYAKQLALAKMKANNQNNPNNLR